MIDFEAINSAVASLNWLDESARKDVAAVSDAWDMPWLTKMSLDDALARIAAITDIRASK